MAGSSARPGAVLIGTHSQTYNAHAINHAYGLAAAPVAAAPLVYSAPYVAGYSAYHEPLFVSRR